MGGVEPSFAYTLAKGAFGWLRRQLARPIHWWRKRKFVEEGWVPLLESINKGTEQVFSADILSESPKIKIREQDEGRLFRKFRKKLTVFVSDEEMKGKELENDKFLVVAKHIIRVRTDRFRPFLPAELRQATAKLATKSVIWDVRPDAIDDFYDESETLYDERQLDAETKVEQMMFAGEYDDFCLQVIEEHEGAEPGPRIHRMVGESFKRSFTELQKSFRGFLCRISKNRLAYYLRGLKGLLLPYGTDSLPRYDDAHAFLWIYPDGIMAFAPIQNITRGRFDDLWQLYGRSHCNVEGENLDDVCRKMTNWVKGHGGKKGKVTIGKPSSGEALQVSIALLEEAIKLVKPIDKNEFRGLTKSRLTDFAMLTQKQVNTLLQRGR